MTTIHDVARAAGVSIATVSRAVHGSPGVAESTRQRVLATATELGYVASSAAAGLAGGRTNVVAVLAPRLRGRSLTTVGAVAVALQAADRQALLVDVQTAAARPSVLHRRVDGIVVVADGHLDVDLLTRLSDLDVPSVLVDAAAGDRPVTLQADVAVALLLEAIDEPRPGPVDVSRATVPTLRGTTAIHR